MGEEEARWVGEELEAGDAHDDDQTADMRCWQTHREADTWEGSTDFLLFT